MFIIVVMPLWLNKFFGVQKLTNRTDVLDKAQLSPEDKAKIKALLDLHNAI